MWRVEHGRKLGAYVHQVELSTREAKTRVRVSDWRGQGNPLWRGNPLLHRVAMGASKRERKGEVKNERLERKETKLPDNQKVDNGKAFCGEIKRRGLRSRRRCTCSLETLVL